MTHSMTAFARKTAQGPWGSASCELRSVNHRYLELAVRLPEGLSALEMPCRERLRQQISRGKVDCQFRLQLADSENAVFQVNRARAKALVSAVQNVMDLLPQVAPISPLDLLRWPEILQTVDQTVSDTLSAILLDLLDETLADFTATRQREGKELDHHFALRLDAIEAALAAFQPRLPDLLAQQRTRLMTRLADAGVTVDPSRLEQEIVMFAHKMDVAEEIERLEAHVTEVRRVLQKEKVAGRRLDFLMQEMNREANTLGSKSNDKETTRTSVELKVLIEQMREQVQNIE